MASQAKDDNSAPVRAIPTKFGTNLALYEYLKPTIFGAGISNRLDWTRHGAIATRLDVQAWTFRLYRFKREPRITALL
jgi:hypothetical protein